MARVRSFRCSECGREEEGAALVTVCGKCQRPFLATYDLAPLAALQPRSFAARRRDLWRYHEVLPLAEDDEPVSLGEGMTPLVELPRIGRQLGIARLLGKHEGFHPTGSFKDRGMSAAITGLRARGVERVALPSAGNAASSAAAYAARAGMRCRVVMPKTTPAANQLECRLFGAEVELVDGSIREAAAHLKQTAGPEWFLLNTLREPFRLEGKKTMGYELWEALGGRLPDAIVYPAGGGTGLIGMWKAFDELMQAGHVRARPRMFAVQAQGCAPIVRAFESGADEATAVAEPRTLAAGLRVPAAIGDRLMLRALRESGGGAVAVGDEAIRDAALRLARTEGLLVSPEAAATIAALELLRVRGRLDPQAETVVFLTASGLKNLDQFAGWVAAD
jgi:threonine synthase